MLIQKAVEKEEFLEFAPCLLKQVAGKLISYIVWRSLLLIVRFNARYLLVHSPIAFKTYFQDIVDYKRQECITVSLQIISYILKKV